ncbi:DNA ligase 1-like [Mercenaria mercenaria]|uniref:DNA ligase 1-like n=1 Tax=Mercenaria mercenaria TaxID=6596 RepID=UPI00234E696B|nr:DNA ligase 1-like [Mercenaria mercenaria]
MAETDINSPPRPRRVMAFDVHSTPQATCAKDKVSKDREDADMLMKFEDGLVDRAVSDLPNIASQVFSLNKDQNSEIKRQQKLLAFVQDKVKEGEEKVNEIELEIKCVMNKIFMKEEEGKDSNKRIKQMDAEIKSLITKVIDKEQEVSQKKENADLEIRNLQKQLEKVENYKENVKQSEQATSTAFNDLQKVKEEVEELKKQKEILDKDPEDTERLVSGVVEKELSSEIEDFKSQLLQGGSDVKLNIIKVCITFFQALT